MKTAYDLGLAEPNLTKRDSILSDALASAIRDQAVIPLYNQIGVWAVKPGLSFTPRIDELTMADTVVLK